MNERAVRAALEGLLLYAGAPGTPVTRRPVVHYARKALRALDAPAVPISLTAVGDDGATSAWPGVLPPKRRLA